MTHSYIYWFHQFMNEQNSRLKINVSFLKRPQQGYMTQISPALNSARRRKSRAITGKRSNEQMIKDSHEELMRYIEGVDEKVQDIIKTHEGQFLGAYQKHIKKVREEMQEIRRQSLNNASSEKAFQEKIDCLQKQLVIFRDQSLGLFNKIQQKQKEVHALGLKIKDLQSYSQHTEQQLLFLTKRNKQLQAALAAMSSQRISRESKSESKRYQDTPSLEKRPFTSTKSSQGSPYFLKNSSNIKQDGIFQLSSLKQKLSEQIGAAKMVNIETVFRAIQEGQQKTNSESVKQSKVLSQNPRLYSKQKRKSQFQILENQITKIKSQQLAQRNEYFNIIKACVEQVRKDIFRKNNASSLNYFKTHGPKSFIEFKKIDKYLIMEMVFRNEEILHKLYQIIFNVQ